MNTALNIIVLALAASGAIMIFMMEWKGMKKK